MIRRLMRALVAAPLAAPLRATPLSPGASRARSPLHCMYLTMTRLEEFVMRKTFGRPAGGLALLCASLAANASMTFTDIYVQQNYFQTGAGSYVDLMSSPLAGASASLGANGPGGNVKVQFMAGVAAPSDFTSIAKLSEEWAGVQIRG